MAFKPFCGTCISWHTEQEGHMTSRFGDHLNRGHTPRREPERIEIACTILAETDKAYLVDAGNARNWVPKSL